MLLRQEYLANSEAHQIVRLVDLNAAGNDNGAVGAREDALATVNLPDRGDGHLVGQRGPGLMAQAQRFEEDHVVLLELVRAERDVAHRREGRVAERGVTAVDCGKRTDDVLHVKVHGIYQRFGSLRLKVDIVFVIFVFGK